MVPVLDLPPVTDDHRRRAFALFAWPGMTFEQAMAMDMRRRFIEARAHCLRTKEARAAATTTDQADRRPSWCAQTLIGTARPATQPNPRRDNKRAAAGDWDDDDD